MANKKNKADKKQLLKEFAIALEESLEPATQNSPLVGRASLPATPQTRNGVEWSPTNRGTANLVDVQDNVYDNGTSGDSNLTQVTQHPSAGSGQAPGSGQPHRVTQNFYDWRDREVGSKQGVLFDGSGAPNPAAENDATHRGKFDVETAVRNALESHGNVLPWDASNGRAAGLGFAAGEFNLIDILSKNPRYGQ